MKLEDYLKKGKFYVWEEKFYFIYVLKEIFSNLSIEDKK